MSRICVCLPVMLVVVLSAVGSAGAVEGTVSWEFELESSGQDAAWSSQQRVNWGYWAYDWAVESEFEVYDGISWSVSDVNDVESSAAAYRKLPIEIMSRTFDANDVSGTLAVWVDRWGYAHASLTDVEFGQSQAGEAVEAVSVAGAIQMKGLNILWHDDFSEYEDEILLDEADSWSAWDDYPDTNDAFWVRQGRVHYRNNWWQDSPRFATADGAEGLYDGDNYRISVIAQEDENEAYQCEFYLFGRRSGQQWVRVHAGYGPYRDEIWIGASDSDGFEEGHHYVADYDRSRPVYLELIFENGNEVTARVSHAGRSRSISWTTTVVSGGLNGFVAHNPWGFAGGYFDDFMVLSNEPFEPAYCGDQGTLFYEGDLTGDCEVGIEDLGILLDSWLETTDPQDEDAWHWYE